MPWVKLDDQIFSNPKIIELSKDAKLLYLAGLTLASSQLTDGLLSPASVKVTLALVDAKPRAVNELENVGLWQRVDGGHQIHDFLKYNRTAAQVKAEREANANRQGRYRDRHPSIETDVTETVSNGDSNAVTETVSNGTNNTHPVPVPRSVSNETRVRAAPKPERPRPPDPIWDVCVSLYGKPSNKDERGKLNSAIAALKESGATPDEIVRRDSRMRAKWPRIEHSANALSGNWSKFADADPDDGWTAEQWAQYEQNGYVRT